jgi:hypothetical protein
LTSQFASGLKFCKIVSLTVKSGNFLAAKKVDGKNLIMWSHLHCAGEDSQENPRREVHFAGRASLRETRVWLSADGTPKVSRAIVKSLATPKQSKGSDMIIIEPHHIVICGGPILTPQLLYNSGFRPQRGDNDPPESEPAHPFLSLPALVWHLDRQFDK